MAVLLFNSTNSEHAAKITKYNLHISVLPDNTNGQRKLSNPAPSQEAEALHCYINQMYGQKIISGQIWSGWGFDEISNIKTQTGKEPALLGLDFIQESANNNVVTMATNW
jgi:mannan endo-1,4-beta-mannosidase